MAETENIVPDLDDYLALQERFKAGEFSIDDLTEEGWAQEADRILSELISDHAAPEITQEFIDTLANAAEEAGNPELAASIKAQIEALNMLTDQAAENTEVVAQTLIETVTPLIAGAAEGSPLSQEDFLAPLNAIAGEEGPTEIDTALADSLSRRLAELMVADIALGGALSAQVADLKQMIALAASGQPIPAGMLESASFANIATALHTAQTGGTSSASEQTLAQKQTAQAIEDMIIAERYHITAQQAHYVAQLESEYLRESAADLIKEGHDHRVVVDMMQDNVKFFKDAGFDTNTSNNMAIAATKRNLTSAEVNTSVDFAQKVAALATPEATEKFQEDQKLGHQLQFDLQTDQPELEAYFEQRKTLGSSFNALDIQLMEALKNGTIDKETFLKQAASLNDTLEPFRKQFLDAHYESATDVERELLEAHFRKPLEEVDLLKEMPVAKAHQILKEAGIFKGETPPTEEEFLARLNALEGPERAEAMAAWQSTALDVGYQSMHVFVNEAVKKDIAAGKSFEEITANLAHVIHEVADPSKSTEQKITYLSQLDSISAEQKLALNSLIERYGDHIDADTLTKAMTGSISTAAAAHGAEYDTEKVNNLIATQLAAKGANETEIAFRKTFRNTLESENDRNIAYKKAYDEFAAANPDHATGIPTFIFSPDGKHDDYFISLHEEMTGKPIDTNIIAQAEETAAQHIAAFERIVNSGYGLDPRYQSYSPYNPAQPINEPVIESDGPSKEEVDALIKQQEREARIEGRAALIQFNADPSKYGPDSDVFVNAADYETTLREEAAARRNPSLLRTDEKTGKTYFHSGESVRIYDEVESSFTQRYETAVETKRLEETKHALNIETSSTDTPEVNKDGHVIVKGDAKTGAGGQSVGTVDANGAVTTDTIARLQNGDINAPLQSTTPEASDPFATPGGMSTQPQSTPLNGMDSAISQAGGAGLSNDLLSMNGGSSTPTPLTSSAPAISSPVSSPISIEEEVAAATPATPVQVADATQPPAPLATTPYALPEEQANGIGQT